MVSAIPMPANKRNYRNRAEHLVLARGIKDIKKKMGEVIEGRPSKEEQIKVWRLANPNGKKIDCHRETGITRPTIDKWW